MKKLMIVACLVALAAASQAATVSWKSGTSIKGATEKTGAFNSTTLALADWTMKVWIVDSFEGLDTAEKIYNAYKSATGGTTAVAVGSSAAQGKVAEMELTKDKDYKAVILATYNDGKTDWYIANTATVHTDATDGPSTIGNLMKNVGGTGGTAITGWTAVAPEPTSGMLLLLGVAGLALKRRRA